MNDYERPNQGKVSSHPLSRKGNSNFIGTIYEKSAKISEFQFPKVTSSWNSEIHICWNSISLLSFSKISCLNSMRMRSCDVTNLPFFNTFLVFPAKLLSSSFQNYFLKLYELKDYNKYFKFCILCL